MDGLFGNLFAEAPNLAALIGRDGFPKRAAKGSLLSHHPLVYLTRARKSWRRETLKVLDTAIQIVRPILDRTDRVRRFSSRLRDGTQFNPAIAELVACARLSRMTAASDSMVIDPPEGGPDIQLDLGGRRIYAEVYAPRCLRELDIIDDIRERLAPYSLSCRFHLIFTRPLKRQSGLSKNIAEKLKAIAGQMLGAGIEVAEFFASDLSKADGWTVRMGTVDGASVDNVLVGWAHRDEYSDGGTQVLGSIDTKYVPTEEEARDAISGLEQLVQGATNLLIVDLSGRTMDRFTLKAYEEAAANAGFRHPELSAVLLTGRSCRPRPAPSAEVECCAWYRVIPNPTCSEPFSQTELTLLEKPGLVIPGTPAENISETG